MKFKRIFDIIFSLVVLIILLPIIIIVFCILFLDEKPIFTQKRIGLNNKCFKIYKFRTMVHNNQGHNDLIKITKFGMFLRKFSIDEIPQLFNVLKGDMSIIGPRPLLVEYLPLFSEVQKFRHTVKPGITGWAQINGRNAISWKKKFELDIWYIQNYSLKLDLKILFYTFFKIINSKDVNQSNDFTMEKFNGKN